MKKQLTSIILVLSISACTNTIATSTKENVDQDKKLTTYDSSESYSELLWVEKADPNVDALKAVKQGSNFLWAYRTRNEYKIPGIDESSLVLVREKYKLKLAPAMGGVVHGSKHLELQLKFLNYAKTYNKIIINN